MSDFKIPDLPSDDELGITKDDHEKYGEDAEPELTPEEQAALLGDTPGPSTPPPDEGSSAAPPPTQPDVGSPAEAPAGRKAGKKAKTPKPPKPPRPPKERRPRSLDPAPRTRWRGPVTFVILAAVGFLSSSYRAVPSPEPANAPDTVFSSARAMASLVEIARQAHPVGSPEHARVRGYIMSRLGELGLNPSVQTATVVVRRGLGLVRAVTVRNVVARIPGTASTGAVLVDAHYDGAGLSHAAADDGAGVVSVLEAIRALKEGPPLKNDVIVLLSDGEELGLMGARAFVDQDSLMSDVKVVINLEMRGAGGPAIMFQTAPDNGWIIHQLQAGDPDAYANSLSYEVYKRMPNGTDFSVYEDAGRQGMDFAAIARAHVYHQAFDSPENLSEGTLQNQGVNALSMLRQLGNADLATVTAPDAVYVTVPILGLVVYPASWVMPLTALILLLTALSFVTVLRKGGTFAGIGLGFAASLVAAVAAGAAGYGLVLWLPHFHPELGGIVGSTYHSEGWYVLALLGAALFAVTTVFGLLLRRKLSLAELALGAVLIPVAAATVLTFVAPAGALDLQWPALAGVLGVLAASLLPGDRPGLVAWVVLLLLAIPASVILVPLTELVWLAGSIRVAMYLGVLMTLSLLMVLPLLDTLREPNAWWTPLVALVLGGVFLGVGMLQAKPSDTRPEPSTLLYAMDRGTDQAWWATDTASVVSQGDTTPDPARLWARQHAGIAGAFGAPRPFGEFLTRPLTLAASPATELQAPLPQVALLADSMEDGVRHAYVAARSLVGAESMIFKLPGTEAGALVAVNGRPVPAASHQGAASTAPSQLEYWGVPDSLVVLDFKVNPAATALDISLVERIFQPTALLGKDVFSRPANLTPNVRFPTDEALLRTPLRVDLATGTVSVATAMPQGMTPQAGGAPGATGAPVAGADSTKPPSAAPGGGDTAKARPDTTGGGR